MRAPEPGLCARCRHSRTTTNSRGSIFYLCDEASNDPRLRKYPALPVLSCVAFDQR